MLTLLSILHIRQPMSSTHACISIAYITNVWEPGRYDQGYMLRHIYIPICHHGKAPAKGSSELSRVIQGVCTARLHQVHAQQVPHVL